MKKDNNKYWISFEIKVSHISDNCYVPMNKYKSKRVESNKSIIINDIEYNYIRRIV